jgi:hypothetical protein
MQTLNCQRVSILISYTNLYFMYLDFDTRTRTGNFHLSSFILLLGNIEIEEKIQNGNTNFIIKYAINYR